ncbi:hypothetical protein GTN66_05240 [bacterium]|nr:hypothetical protein [bacterium]NIN92747.1 hypothetical protein [bacterium]NIO18728.1 hypothetical protein [bacterium]NIO73804.1 hypothetical protein [bacterium]
MLILVKIVGIILVAIGIVFLLSPKRMRQWMVFCEKGVRPYMMGALRILVGIVFLLAAPQSRVVWVMVTIGILALLGGITIFILGLERFKSMLRWSQGRSLPVLRLIALLAIAIGVLIVYST